MGGTSRTLCSIGAALLLGCSPRAVLDVRVAAVPEGTASIEISATMGDGAADATAHRVNRGLERFLLRLPEGTSSTVSLALQGWSAKECLTARGGGQVAVAGPGTYPLEITLEPVAGCTLSVTRAGPGLGTIATSVPGVDCSEGCAPRLPTGTAVTLRAQARPGSIFTGWSGACFGSGDCRVVTHAGATELQASFIPELCGTAGWCWRWPLPQGNVIGGVFGLSEQDIWLVGDAGTVLRFDGRQLTAVASGTSLRLYGVWGSAADDLWIVGGDSDEAKAALLHYDGQALTPVAAPVRATLRAVFGTSRSDVWAVGQRGALIHFDGDRWSPIDGGTSQLLRAVWASGPDDAWIVGDGRTVLRGSASSLRALGSLPADLNPESIWGTGPADVWIGGSGAAPSTGSMAHWDGRTLTQVWGGGGNPSAILGSGPKDVWATTGDGLMHLEEGTWQRRMGVRLPGLGAGWSAAPGRLYLAGLDGGAYRWDAGALSPIAGTAGSGAIQDLWSTPDGVLWAVGVTTQGSLILRHDASGTRQVPSGTNLGLNGIWGHKGELWVVGGGGVLLRGNGRAFGAADSGTGADLFGIWGTATSDGPPDLWLVGASGTILHGDGVRFTAVASGTTQTLLAIWGSGPRDLWVAGTKGTLLHGDGTSFTSVATGTAAMLRSVWGAGPDEIWVAGDVLLRGQRGTFSKVPHPGSPYLFRVWGRSPTDVWLLGASGTLVHWDGSTLDIVDAQAGGRLLAMTAAPSGDLYIGGGSALLRRPQK